ncbi:MAG: hypothetical protein M3680_16420 [Myxococcota bacterium]|nr:hypothetical protein [Myxococcota bacterium]
MTMAAHDTAEIATLIAAGEDQAAFAKLRTGFGWPAGKTIELAELPTWLELLAELATRRGAEPLAEIAQAVVREPDSPDQLYDLGYALIDAGVPGIAATVLWRCLELVGESEEVLCELVSALESALAYSDALAILDEHPALLASSFLCRYLRAFNAAMAGRLDITRTATPDLAPETPEEEAMQGALAEMVRRADRVGGATLLDDRDLRGWHYVLTGGLLLHQSPYGFDEPMHGRYAWLGDSVARIATGIERLARLVQGLDVPCVYAPPGHNHEVIAHAVARKLGLSIAPWPAIGAPAPGLVVMYDLGELPESEIARLLQRRAGQIVFAHASPWTEDSPIAADVTTLLYQTITPPWGEAVVVDPESQEVQTAPADDRPPAVIAEDILGSAGLDGDDLVAEQLDRFDALVDRCWPPEAGTRSRAWAGGPVPSNRFT